MMQLIVSGYMIRSTGCHRLFKNNSSSLAYGPVQEPGGTQSVRHGNLLTKSVRIFSKRSHSLRYFFHVNTHIYELSLLQNSKDTDLIS